MKYTIKRYFFSLLCTLITSFCAYSQDNMIVPLDNSPKTFILTDELDSEYVINASDNSSAVSSLTSYANTANSVTRFDYKNTQECSKYKVLRAIGWSSFGVGITATFYGLIGLGLSLNDGGNGHPFIAIIATGGALTLSSVPILIIANKYKRKAKKMALNIGVSSINTPSISNRIDYTPALSLALNF